MKVVITGGCGFIGSHAVDRFLEEGYETVVIDNMAIGRRNNLDQHEGNKKLTIIEADVSDENIDLTEVFAGATYIIHLAALADIVPSINNPEKYYQANVNGTFRVLQEASKVEGLKKFVYSASSSCYGIPDKYPTEEDADIRPEYPYALTKRLGEELALHWGKVYKLPVVSLRFFNVYGPRSRTSGTYGAVFGVFLAQKLAGRPFTVVGDGEQSRDFTYVTDVVDAVFKAATTHRVTDEVMNVGSGNHYKVNYLVELLGGEKTFLPKRPGEPDCTFADTKKIRKLLGWSPQVSFEEGVNKLLENIDYWREAPVWTPESIKKETKTWFDTLS